MDAAVAQVALIFLPGLIWASMDEAFAQRGPSTQFAILLRAFLFGIFTYALVYLGYLAMGRSFDLDGVPAGAPGDAALDLEAFLDEILWSIPLALGLGTGWLALRTYRIPLRALRLIRAVRGVADEDIWSFTFNSDQAFVEFVHVKDLRSGLTYAGYVNAFSEHDGVRELLLRDAAVWDGEGKEVSRAPYLYLSLAQDHIWIEFPHREKDAKHVRFEDARQVRSERAEAQDDHAGQSAQGRPEHAVPDPGAAAEAEPDPTQGRAASQLRD